MSTAVDHPSHYAEATHGIAGECITYSEHLNFVRGNAFKYVWRAAFKGDAKQDLEKALWYVKRDISYGGDIPSKPGHLTHTLADGPRTLRRTILLNLWLKHDLTATADLIHAAIYDPTRLDEEN